MPRRVNPTMLISLVVVLVLSLGISASAKFTGNTAGSLTEGAQQPTATSADTAVAVGEAQLGKPFLFGADGPNAFSCSGLVRYIMRTIGVDPNAPWVPEEYLSRYPSVDPTNPQPGDILIYPGWATMYVGNGMLLNANEMEGFVTHTPISVAGVPLGAVRPYSQSSGGALQPPIGVTDPLAQPPLGTTDPLAQPSIGTADPLAQPPIGTTDPMTAEQQPLATEEPLLAQPLIEEPLTQF